MNTNSGDRVSVGGPKLSQAEKEEAEFKLAKSVVLAALKNFKERDYQWLWGYLNRNFRLMENIHRRYKYDQDKKIEQLVYIIKDGKISLDDILKQHSHEVLDLEDFKWINQKDYRQLIYIVNHIVSNHNTERPDTTFDLDESLFEYILWYFDNRIHARSKEAKLEKIKLFRNAWLEQTTPDKYTKWLIPKEDEKWEWASEYLRKKDKWLDRFIPLHQGEHLHTLILASLDDMNWKKNIHENHIFVDKMKSAWSLQKFRRAEKVKNKYHLPLTKKTKQQLDELALLYNKKESEVLRMLIQNAHKAEMLDDKGKNMYP